MIGNQVVSTMFDINTSIHMARIVPFWDWDEDPGNAPSVTCLTQVAMDIGFEYLEDYSMVIMLVISLIYMLSHISTLYWSVAMFCHIVAPLCILSWLRPD
jgi:hypothetical protein